MSTVTKPSCETPTGQMTVRPTSLFMDTISKQPTQSFVPESHHKAVKQAFYNAAALVCMALLVGAAVGVYYVLESFIEPLFWALIFGSFLHPSKRALTSTVREWLKQSQQKERTLSVSFCLLPFSVIEWVASSIYDSVTSHWRLLLVVMVALPVAQVVYYFSSTSLSILWQLLAAFELFYDLFDVRTGVAIAIVGGYFAIVFFCWTQPIVQRYAPMFAPLVWVLLLRYICHPKYLGSLSYPLFTLVGGAIIIGALHDGAVHLKLAEAVSFYFRVLLELLPLPSSLFHDDSRSNDTTDSADSALDAAETSQQQGGEEADVKPSVEVGELDAKPSLAPVAEGDEGLVTPRRVKPPKLTTNKVTFSETIDTKSITTPEPTSTASNEIDSVAETFKAAPPVTSTAEAEASRHSRMRSISASTAPTLTPTRTHVCTHTHESTLSRRFRYASWRSQSFKTVKKSSRVYFVALLWATVLTHLWTQLWLVAKFVPILCLVVLIKYVWDRLRAGARLRAQAIAGCTAAGDWLAAHQAVLLPFASLRNAGALLGRLDALVTSMIDSNLDFIVTAVLIVVLIIIMVIGTVFLFFQIQNESGHLVTEISTMVNNLVSVDIPLISTHVQSSYLKTLIDGAVANAYAFGKKWMTEKLDVLLASTTTNQTARIEIQQKLNDLFDRVANISVTAFANSSKISGVEKANLAATGALDIDVNSTYSQRLLSLMPDFSQLWQALDLSQLLAFANENLEFLTSLLKSIWLILRGNLEIAFTFLTASIWMVLSGGTVIVNLVLKTLVFFSGLYYLLAFSHQTYIPVRWISHLTQAQSDVPVRRTPEFNTSLPAHDSSKRTYTTVSGFYAAVERAVNGVFLCSLKMGAFYGIYTWLTHTIFGSNLVYLPVVFAAILAAVPFIGTYWAALPACLEIAFIRQEPLVAVFFFICHLVPSYFVDIALYSEIEGGGHPYLTGLAIAGGVYCFGLEGAIVGPILLCCMLVAVHVYSAVLSSNESFGF